MNIYTITTDTGISLDSNVPAWSRYQAVQRFTRKNPTALIVEVSKQEKCTERDKKVIIDQWRMKDPAYPTTRPQTR